MTTRHTLLAALVVCLISSSAWATPPGSLAGWGWNDYGETNVPAGNDFVAIAGGGYHVLAIRKVPEPGSWALVAAALACLGLRRRGMRERRGD